MIFLSENFNILNDVEQNKWEFVLNISHVEK